MRAAVGLALAALLLEPAAAAPAGPAADWRRVATGADRTRLREWRNVWLTALASARTADGGEIARDPLLFAPDRALPGAIPPVGTYRCRTIKLGAKGTAMRAYTAYPWSTCQIGQEARGTSFAKAGGAQRAFGFIYTDGTARAVFLGAMMLGDERRPMAYGRDATRDMAGLVERIGEGRWRITLPAPPFESQLDVIEIVPD